jgi:tRNA(adenine34) deaminase
MCAGALIQARMGTVLIATADPRRGALGGCLDLSKDPSVHHAMEVIGGVMGVPAKAQLEGWFRRRRERRSFRSCAYA